MDVKHHVYLLTYYCVCVCVCVCVRVCVLACEYWTFLPIPGAETALLLLRMLPPSSICSVCNSLDAIFIWLNFILLLLSLSNLDGPLRRQLSPVEC